MEASTGAGTVRFVALGDSLTAGVGDGVSMGRHRELDGRGWAAVLADCLGPPGGVEFANLSTTGATIRDVRATQLPAAMAREPQVASVLAGLNDILRVPFEPDRMHADLTHVIGTLAGGGATVLMGRLHDPGRIFRLPGPARRLVTRRVAAVNAVVTAVAHEHAVPLHDTGAHPAIYQLSTWDVDRIHPSARGHRLLARAYAELLEKAGVPLWRLPDVGPDEDAATTAAHLWWIARCGLPWLVRHTGAAAPPLLAVSATWLTTALAARLTAYGGGRSAGGSAVRPAGVRATPDVRGPALTA